MTNEEKELYKIVGKRMKHSREMNNLTQKELADRIGLTKNHISALENGRLSISGAVLYEYAKTLGDSSDSFLGIGEPKILPELSAIISNKLDKDQQLMLIRVLNAYIGSNGNS